MNASKLNEMPKWMQNAISFMHACYLFQVFLLTYDEEHTKSYSLKKVLTEDSKRTGT